MLLHFNYNRYLKHDIHPNYSISIEMSRLIENESRCTQNEIRIYSGEKVNCFIIMTFAMTSDLILEFIKPIVKDRERENVERDDTDQLTRLG